jgi:hypothetical protein
MPVGSGPKARPAADSDETGQPSARTLLFGIFGGKSPRLQALLPHRETGESVKGVKEKKDGLDRARRADKRIPSKNGGGGLVRPHRQNKSVRNAQKHFFPHPSFVNMGAILPDPHNSVKRYGEKRGVFRVFSMIFFSGFKMVR